LEKKIKKGERTAANHHTDTYLYLLSLALALSIHNKLQKLQIKNRRGGKCDADNKQQIEDLPRTAKRIQLSK
jgi:hypothetical protein